MQVSTFLSVLINGSIKFAKGPGLWCLSPSGLWCIPIDNILLRPGHGWVLKVRNN